MTRRSSDLAVRVVARRLLALRLLEEGEDVEEVRLAAGVGIGVLADWCRKPDGELLVSEEVAVDLSHRADEAAQRWRAVRERRRVKRGERLTDSDRTYLHLLEAVEEAKREYKAFHGVPYLRGWDDGLDEMVSRLEHWHG